MYKKDKPLFICPVCGRNVYSDWNGLCRSCYVSYNAGNLKKCGICGSYYKGKYCKKCGKESVKLNIEYLKITTYEVKKTYYEDFKPYIPNLSPDNPLFCTFPLCEVKNKGTKLIF